MIKTRYILFLPRATPLMVCVCAAALIGAAGCDKPGEKSGKTAGSQTEGKRGEAEEEHSSGPSIEKDRVKTARSFLDQLNGDEFENAAAMFDDTMRKDLPVDTLDKTWKSI